MVIHLIKFFLEGFIIGLGKIIPGVSGSLFACLFGVYESIIECITKPKMLIKNFNVMFPLILGIFLSIIFGSGVISILLEHYYKQSMAFFIGMMAFEIFPMIKRNKEIRLKRKEIMGLIILNFIIILLMFVPLEYNPVISVSVFRDLISLILCGILDAIATIIPGISGTALLMLVGYYKVIIHSLSTLYLPVIIPFLIGFIVGVIALARVINYVFKNYKEFMNMAILCLAIISILVLLLELVRKILLSDILGLLVFFVIGLFLTYITNKKPIIVSLSNIN